VDGFSGMAAVADEAPVRTGASTDCDVALEATGDGIAAGCKPCGRARRGGGKAVGSPLLRDFTYPIRRKCLVISQRSQLIFRFVQQHSPSHGGDPYRQMETNVVAGGEPR
jgi:hypothetical protein